MWWKQGIWRGGHITLLKTKRNCRKISAKKGQNDLQKITMIYHKRQITQKCEKNTQKKERKAKDNYEKNGDYEKREKMGKMQTMF